MPQTKPSKRYALHVLAFAMLALGATKGANAACSTTGMPTTFTYGTIAVANSLGVGEVIPGTVQNFAFIGKCANPTIANTAIVACPSGSTVAVPGMTGVYPTNLAGVGMRMRDKNGTPLVGTGNCSATSSFGNTAADGSFSVSGNFELVKTGPISAGTITSATYSWGALNTGTSLTPSTTSVASGTAVRPASCSVTSATANQTISLATISPSMLGSVGATGARTPFSISINCQSGVKVAVTFTSTSGNSGVASVLGSVGTATGVGVQLLNGSLTPINLDAALPLTSGTTGDMSFPFYGQYYRLGASAVTSGTVKASAIFTMSYQ
ncbi:fimbrial protein [Paraburkholderia fungorum]|jgi:type 1 fimbria pilin|uniref:fimbrial protein n=1 Tax=Paraburkholderia fungorum TaxID=134537 RepID=UPI003878105D